MDKNNITVLVVGASGATGKHLVEQLLIQKHTSESNCKVSGKVAGIMEK